MRHTRTLGWLVTALALALAPRPAAAQAPHPEDTSSVTRHSIRIGGQAVNYTATAGTYWMQDDKGKNVASLFYVYYTRDDVADRAARPLFISFNGGPGSSSVWMHMGFTGPRRVVYDEDGFMLRPPYRLEDNQYSILDIADIVYIDEPPHRFHGVMEDIQSVGDFIQAFVTRNRRWDSPKFVIGESYGTTRASGLAGYLQTNHRMYLNGVILVSMTGLDVEKGVDVGFATGLPHYTATAWYHKALPADLQAKPLRAVLDEAEPFAMGPYLSALVKGHDLPDAERDQVASAVARITGLSADYVKRADLRVGRERFRKELLRSRGLTVGRLDSRYTGLDRDEAGETYDFDPAMESWNGPFAGVVNTYLRDELKYETDLTYNIFGPVNPWNRSGTVNVGEMLRGAMARNPFLRVMILEGYYDGATDYFGAEYTIGHLDPGGQLKDRFTWGFYECGHMMYIKNSELAKTKKDLAAFVQAASR